MPTDSIRIVCLGGGTGQSTLLGALRQNPAFDITAIVAMTDSGGSSGVLRDRLGVLPPSDLQRCMAALSPYPYVRDILNERIIMGQPPHHTGGNLLMAALEKQYGRRDAVSVLAKMFRIQGSVVPVSYDDGNLHARFTDGSEATSEVAVDDGVKAGKTVAGLSIVPGSVASSEALTAIAAADVIIIGPGSLFTSIAPNFLVQGIRDAVNTTECPVLLVMNLMSEGVDMVDVDAGQVMGQWVRLLGLRRSVRVLTNDAVPTLKQANHFADERKYPIRVSPTRIAGMQVTAPLWRDYQLARHDQDVLARALSVLIPQLTM